MRITSPEWWEKVIKQLVKTLSQSDTVAGKAVKELTVKTHFSNPESFI